MQNGKDKNGIWRTINGRHIFIKDGQSLDEAMKEFGLVAGKQNNLNTRGITHRDPTVSIRFEKGTKSEDYVENIKSLENSIESLKNYSDTEKRTILSNNMNAIAESYTDVEKFIINSQIDNTPKRLLIGKVNDELSNKIQSEANVNVNNYSIALNSSDIQHIFKAHGNEKVESNKGQIAITNDNIISVIDTVIKPDKVSAANDGGLLFTKTVNGKINTITLISNKYRNLTLKTAYIVK